MPSSFGGRALSWKHVDGVLEVELHRPRCNEIGTTTLEELERLVDHLSEGARGARALLLYSSLDAGFCAGADLRELHDGLIARRRESPLGKAIARFGDGRRARVARRLAAPLVRREIRAFIDRIHAVFDALDHAPLATVSAVHGVCFGGGLELALTTDVIIADKTARFAFPELRLGIVPGFGGVPRLSRDVGNAVVRDLLLTGRSLRADRAHEAGLVSQVVPKGRHVEVARRTAQQTAKLDPEVVRAAKAFAKPLPRAMLDREKDLFCQLITEPRVLEALERFVADDGPLPYLP
jgi:enoyl-CoA hydratase/carnithine racemase